MLLRQLFDPPTSTYTYLLADMTVREAILIDPVREQVARDMTLLAELGLRLVATVETHVHADHITGAWLLKQRLGSEIIYPRTSGVSGADRLVGEGDTISFGRFSLEVRLTPGHTDGCASYVTSDRGQVFTGDALLIHGSGRTDFQQGDARRLYRSVWDQILSLPDETRIYPGHDYQGRTVTTVREEKQFNPRLGLGQTEDTFVAIMAALSLPYPRRLDEALPANQSLGRLSEDLPVAAAPSPDVALWSAVHRSAGGVWQVTPDWVASHGSEVRLIDVREPHEFSGPLGHISGAELVPLAEVQAAAAGWDRTAPLVTLCRSSGRSDQAARVLEGLGFQRVASMVGGMLAWGDRHLTAASASRGA